MEQDKNQDEAHLIKVRKNVSPTAHGAEIAWEDSKIAYVTARCKGKSVLDLGCVQHDPRFAENRLWLHKAIVAAADSVVGLDLDSAGVAALTEKGYHIIHGDAQDFSLQERFDTIVAGDLIEHLSNFGDFLGACTRHMSADSELIICTPNPWHWHKVFKAMYRAVPVNGEHTCWMCPTTLSQLAARYNLTMIECVYGSSRLKDSFLPLPKRLRHSSWYATLKLVK